MTVPINASFHVPARWSLADLAAIPGVTDVHHRVEKPKGWRVTVHQDHPDQWEALAAARCLLEQLVDLAVDAVNLRVGIDHTVPLAAPDRSLFTEEVT